MEVVKMKITITQKLAVVLIAALFAIGAVPTTTAQSHGESNTGGSTGSGGHD
jgi:hypothetical protein